MNARSESKVVRIMTEALRAEAMPDLAWDRIERDLFACIDAREEQGREELAQLARRARDESVRLFERAPNRNDGRAHWLGFAAAAALIALGVQGASRTSIAPSQNPTAAHLVDIDAV